MTTQTHGIDLSTMDPAALKALAADAAKLAPQVEKERLAACKDAAIELIESHGFTVKDVFPNAKRVHPAAPKFRHPDDESLTWSGRGRKPVWLVELTAAGGEAVAI